MIPRVIGDLWKGKCDLLSLYVERKVRFIESVIGDPLKRKCDHLKV